MNCHIFFIPQILSILANSDIYPFSQYEAVEHIKYIRLHYLPPSFVTLWNKGHSTVLSILKLIAYTRVITLERHCILLNSVGERSGIYNCLKRYSNILFIHFNLFNQLEDRECYKANLSILHRKHWTGTNGKKIKNTQRIKMHAKIKYYY